MRSSSAERLARLLPAAALLATFAAAALELQDDERRALNLPQAAHRIVSLAPGATAMLFAAGAGAYVVGTVQYSDEPPAARGVERIGDAQSVDLERILALHPDIVVAWAGGTSPTQLARLEGVGLPIYRHRLTRLEDVPASLRRLGQLAGTEAQAASAADHYAERIRALRAAYQHAPRERVLLEVWDQPLYTIGRPEIMSDLIASCGYDNLYDDLGTPGPAVTLESVLARDPQKILVLAPDAAAGRRWAAAWQAYPTLRAVREQQIIVWNDQRLSRLGPSIVDAAEALCRALRAARPDS